MALAQLRADADDFEPALVLQRRAMQLEPARDDLLLGMARVLIMKGDTKTARSLLGPLVARGSTPKVKQGARDYLGVAARVELAAADGHEAPVPERLPVTADDPAPPINPVELPKQAQPPPVMVTFSPDRQGDTAGEVILVEVVPRGFKPPGQ